MKKRITGSLALVLFASVTNFLYAGDAYAESDNNYRIVAIIALLGAGVLAVMKLKGMKKK